MESYISPSDEERLRQGNSDAALEGTHAVQFEETGYYTEEELNEARASGKRVVISAWGVAILDAEQ